MTRRFTLYAYSETDDMAVINAKRVYRIMRQNALLLALLQIVGGDKLIIPFC
ncbi:hypothetical protein NXF50_29500 [Klebsiella pneumoniae]|nr:hypothetical protein [Klebsiella pneumoniae]MDS6765633.1 hypothetical protein [Klebsiella pneumoniae]MDS7369073.1 hypothetical protein [Klebsiella pneumoniae]MDS7454510.1 hypothetical protein [Klebsiella pneumoniae]MDS7505628.1 hypothetical protein [Klebsiella pneumoniae]